MRIFFLLMSITLILNANDALNKLIKNGYSFVKTEGIINKHIYLVYNFENIKEKKNKLIILNKENDKVFFESDNALNYPKNNGNGYMVQSLIAEIEDNYLVIKVNILSGTNNTKKIYFKLIDNNFILDKYIQEEGTTCNNWTISNAYKTSSFRSDLYLKEFSFDYFLSNFYNEKSSQNKSKRIILKSFDIDFKNLKNAYLNKTISLKKEALKIIAFDEKEGINCSPEKYLYKYLYFEYPETLSKSNDIAFFFEQAAYYKESIYLLEKILKKYPKRAVAYINLADAYWGNNNKNKAIENYKIYITQMKENAKENKIPKKVFERVNIKDIKNDATSKQIQVKKQYLFDNPKKESKTKMYLIKGDNVKILKEKDNWLYILFKGKKEIKAWIPKNALDK